MTKDELYSKIAEMLPVENTDSKPFRILLSDSLKTYLSYINKTEGIGDEDKKEVAYICEAIKAIVKAQYKGLENCLICFLVKLDIKVLVISCLFRN